MLPLTLLEATRSWLIARPRLLLASVLGCAALVWAAVGSTVWLGHDLIRRLPGKDGLASIGAMAQATTLFDINDRTVFTIFKEQRIEVPLERVSPALIKAILAVEDQRFFDHKGVDVVRVVAAGWANLRDGWAAQGGSTITQQLARQAFLSRDKTLRRKLTEVILATRLERMYSKREILELYLNKIYFGDGLYGAQAASLGYFAKPASDLDVAEAAVLAGVVKSPSVYAPTISMARAVARRNVTGPTITVRAALRTSSNRAAVRMLDQVGIDRTVQFAESVGRMPSVPSLALGSGEVTLDNLVAAYMPFASGGYTRKPTGIRRVEDSNGQVLYEADTSARRVVSDTTAFLMADMLQDVVNSGTAARARGEGFRLPAAGKTGTTNDFADAWFIGFTPKLLTGVWIGLDRPQTILPGGFAGDLAVPVWAKFMKVATRDDKPEWFVPPPTLVPVRVCRVSGQLAGPACDRVATVNRIGDIEYRSYSYTDYFVRGTEPLQECEVHRVSIVDHLMKNDGLREAAPEPPVDSVRPPELKVPDAWPPELPGDQPPKGPSTSGEQAPKKRGFFARLFGMGRGDRKKENR